MSKTTKIILSFLLVAIGISGRVLPHFWNVAPLLAISLFAGAYLGRRQAIVLPLLALFVGDLWLGFYEWPLLVTVYSSYALIGLMSVFLQKQRTMANVLATSLAASTLFFILTNWAVWQFSPWYPKTIAGVIECYALALPFFRNSLLGDLFFTGAFFGAYEFALNWQKNRYFLGLKNPGKALK